MTADVTVVLRWRDPRLADPGRGEGSADCPLPGDALWMPEIEPEHLRSRQLFYPGHLLVTVPLASQFQADLAPWVI